MWSSCFPLRSNPSDGAPSYATRTAYVMAWNLWTRCRNNRRSSAKSAPLYFRLSKHADFLLENVELAYKARNAVAWGEKIPDENANIFNPIRGSTLEMKATKGTARADAVRKLLDAELAKA